MNDETRKRLRMDAEMEGQATIVKNIGKQVSLSQMELVCLVNFAEIGVMSLFAAIDGPTGEDADRELNAYLDRVREAFSKDGSDGLIRLQTSTCAMLRSPKFHNYIA